MTRSKTNLSWFSNPNAPFKVSLKLDIRYPKKKISLKSNVWNLSLSTSMSRSRKFGKSKGANQLLRHLAPAPWKFPHLFEVSSASSSRFGWARSVKDAKYGKEICYLICYLYSNSMNLKSNIQKAGYFKINHWIHWSLDVKQNWKASIFEDTANGFRDLRPTKRSFLEHTIVSFLTLPAAIYNKRRES